MNTQCRTQNLLVLYGLAFFLFCSTCLATTTQSTLSTLSIQSPQTQNDTEQILNKIKLGNKRFASGKIRTDGQSQIDIERLSKGQNPSAVVVSCSDSRVPPEIVFDQKLGDLFTVRSAGQALSATTIASIEYAIEKLGTHLIVVLGHTNCGAVKATIETSPGKSAGSENLDQLVADIRPRLASKLDAINSSKDLKEESWLNAKGVARDIVKRSSIISKAIEQGKAKIQVGLYNLNTGAVEFE